MEYVRMMDILKRGGRVPDPESSSEEIVLEPDPHDVEVAADDIMGAATTGGDEDDEYMESILDTFAPHVGAEFDGRHFMQAGSGVDHQIASRQFYRLFSVVIVNTKFTAGVFVRL